MSARAKDFSIDALIAGSRRPRPPCPGPESSNDCSDAEAPVALDAESTERDSPEFGHQRQRLLAASPGGQASASSLKFLGQLGRVQTAEASPSSSSSLGEDDLQRSDTPSVDSFSAVQGTSGDGAALSHGGAEPPSGASSTAAGFSSGKTRESGSSSKNSGRVENPQILPRCNSEELRNADAHLETKDLWEKFHELGTEMIITKTGR